MQRHASGDRAAARGAAVSERTSNSLLSGATIAVEHDHVCVRNATGWLLASFKIGDNPSFPEFVTQAVGHQEHWLKGDSAPEPCPAPGVMDRFSDQEFATILCGHLVSTPDIAERDREFLEQAYRRFKAASAPPPVLEQWQPIATAPKDGTCVDLWVDGERWSDCLWGAPHHSCGEEGAYCDSDEHSLGPSWVFTTLNHRLETEPSHWRPVPEGPRITKGSDHA